MARMTPVPSEASGGATAAAVASRWAQHERTRMERSEQHFRSVEAWVASRPELCVDGQPCPFAHLVAERIRGEVRGVSDDVFAAQVRLRRDAYLRRVWGDVETDAYLAGSVAA